ncbi:LmeA family phospholipid-binding protein [Parafrigoribacterium humi]|uniref:LmeA family phospholipid-binding protein n=1 Tax=Parafrigoribacterium humi TaxID=3144664 RepID=UPI0032EB2EB0
MTPSPKPKTKPPKRKRRVGTSLRFVLTAGIVSLIVVGVIVADNAARGLVADKIESQVRTSLDVPASTPIDVSVGGTSVLYQLISGSLDRVDVGVARVTLGALSGSAQLTAADIPLDTSKPTRLLRVVFVTDQTALKALFSTVPGLSPKQITIKDSKVILGTEVTIGGFSLPVGIEFTPSASKGKLQLTPNSIVINNLDFTAEELKKSAFGSLAESLFASHSICIAPLLPKGFTLESVYVEGKSIQITVSAENVKLNSKTLSSKGSCEPEAKAGDKPST